MPLEINPQSAICNRPTPCCSPARPSPEIIGMIVCSVRKLCVIRPWPRNKPTLSTHTQISAQHSQARLRAFGVSSRVTPSAHLIPLQEITHVHRLLLPAPLLPMYSIFYTSDTAFLPRASCLPRGSLYKRCFLICMGACGAFGLAPRVCCGQTVVQQACEKHAPR